MASGQHRPECRLAQQLFRKQHRCDRHACSRHCSLGIGRNFIGVAVRMCGRASRQSPCVGRAVGLTIAIAGGQNTLWRGAHGLRVQCALCQTSGMLRAPTFGSMGLVLLHALQFDLGPLVSHLVALMPAPCRAMVDLVGRIRHGRRLAPSSGGFMAGLSAPRSWPSPLVAGAGHGGAVRDVHLWALLPSRGWQCFTARLLAL